MIRLCAHLVLKALSAILVLYWLAGGATRVDFFEEGDNSGDGY